MLATYEFSAGGTKVTKLCSARRGAPSSSRPIGYLGHHTHPRGTTAIARRATQSATAPTAPITVVRDGLAHDGPAQSRAVASTGKPDRALGWLRGAMLALAVLAMAAAVVSWDAQYVLVRSVKHNPTVAALEAGIPDIGAVIFAALGIALALHGRRAIRARVLNVASVGISLAMNALASTPGWRDLAIWVMPSAVYALASDTLIGVVRAWVIAQARHIGQTLADDEPTPMAVIGAAFLWLVRLGMAPVSTIVGFRRWVIDECPAAPAPTTPKPRQRPKAISSASGQKNLPPSHRSAKPGKQAQLIALAAERHNLAAIPVKSVSKIATGVASEIGLAPGTARRVLLAHVRSLQADHNGQHSQKEAS
jgi:hypothetical protein